MTDERCLWLVEKVLQNCLANAEVGESLPIRRGGNSNSKESFASPVGTP